MQAMFSALRAGRDLDHAGIRYSRDEMHDLLCAWIPAEIIVMRACAAGPSVVIAAPHVSFDNWTQYFANRVAADLKCGEVIARNFRDDDGGVMPISIGRHIHVNRPTESTRKGGAERQTDRARQVFEQYRVALGHAGRALPLDLLIELHGHRQHTRMEVATYGLTLDEARRCRDAYEKLREATPGLPDIAIEPLDVLQFTARQAKELGSLREENCRRALHIEIPRTCREDERARSAFRPLLADWLSFCVTELAPQS